jgi:phage head maturation protease
METKSLSIEIKDADKGIVRAVFARTGEVDKHRDWTQPGAFGEQEVRVSSYGHTTTRMGALPVGKGVIREEGRQAIADLQFFMNTASGREHFEVIKEMGALQEWSYGFAVAGTGEVTDAMRKLGVERVLTKLVVHEVSPVLVGAGFGTRTLAVKSEAGAGIAIEIRGIDPENPAHARMIEGLVASRAGADEPAAPAPPPAVEEPPAPAPPVTASEDPAKAALLQAAATVEALRAGTR